MPAYAAAIPRPTRTLTELEQATLLKMTGEQRDGSRDRLRKRMGVQPACRSRVPSRQAPRLCLHVDTTRTDHHPDNPSHPTPRARDLRERLDSAADEGLSRRRLDDGAFRRFVTAVR